MEATKCIKERRSIRRFLDKKIDDSVLKEIVELASFSPSWKNTQICRYTVVKDEKIKEAIAVDGVSGFAGNTANIQSCPELVVLSYKEGICGYNRDGSATTAKGNQWQMFDAGIATQTFCLAAFEKGLGTVIMGIFDEDFVAKQINLPENEVVAALIAIGYPENEVSAPARKSVDDLLRFV